MMSAVEKTVALTSCEMKLLIRGRITLAFVVLLPLLGGLTMGLAGKSTYECPARWGLFAFLPVSAIVLMGLRITGSGILPPGSNGPVSPTVARVSQSLAALTVLVVQGTVYAFVARGIAGTAVGAGAFIGALAASLIVGLAASILLSPKAA